MPAPSPQQYRLLDAFRSLFEGKRYQHRNSSLGDWVSYHLFEDLRALGRSQVLANRIDAHDRILSVRNKRLGITARRGDGTFGEPIPDEVPRVVKTFAVARGRVATIEIGAEVKILAKAMIKQIDRVKSDLGKQLAQFQSRGGAPICIAIVGINRANVCTSYEGKATCPGCELTFDRSTTTDGKKHAHPVTEADEAEKRLRDEVLRTFFEPIVLQYRATNAEPYPFEWVDQKKTVDAYAAALVRISREYDLRFRLDGHGRDPKSGHSGPT